VHGRIERERRAGWRRSAKTASAYRRDRKFSSALSRRFARTVLAGQRLVAERRWITLQDVCSRRRCAGRDRHGATHRRRREVFDQLIWISGSAEMDGRFCVATAYAP
jgi:hypothetical protein